MKSLIFYAMGRLFIVRVNTHLALTNNFMEYSRGHHICKSFPRPAIHHSKFYLGIHCWNILDRLPRHQSIVAPQHNEHIHCIQSQAVYQEWYSASNNSQGWNSCTSPIPYHEVSHNEQALNGSRAFFCYSFVHLLLAGLFRDTNNSGRLLQDIHTSLHSLRELVLSPYLARYHMNFPNHSLPTLLGCCHNVLLPIQDLRFQHPVRWDHNQTNFEQKARLLGRRRKNTTNWFRNIWLSSSQNDTNNNCFHISVQRGTSSQCPLANFRVCQ